LSTAKLIKYQSVLWVIDDTSQVVHDILRELGILLNYIDRFRGALQNDQLLDENNNLMVEEQMLLL
jgi:hypothetical protein